jgi:branched-chain amino acid transport system substrate-binding protein
MRTRRLFLQSGAGAFAAVALGDRPTHAADAPGITGTEIRIGQTMPYSGPSSAYGSIGRTEVAYFKMVNDMGGINRRKVNLISLDDGYSPPKTVEQTRRLIEQEQVAFIFGSLGTAQNAAIRSYLNDNKIPQVFIASGFSMFADPRHYPWTIAFNPSNRTEGHVFAKHVLSTRPDAKIAVLYQNDDLGKDYLNGVKDGLGASHASMLVKEASYEVSEPTVLAGDHPARQRGRHPDHRRQPQGCLAGAPQGLRPRLGARAGSWEHRLFDHVGTQTGGDR